MSDLISRQEAIDAVNEYLRLSEVSKTVQNMTSIQAILRWLPSAQPQRKKGKWITVPGRLGNEVKCDQCGSVFWYWLGNYRFCPSCGSKNIDERGERNV